MTRTIPVPPKEKIQLTEWFNKRDYSVFKNISVEVFLLELEERLALYKLALISNGECSPDLRWQKICNRDSVIINASGTQLSKSPETAGISTIKKEYLQWYELANSKAKKYADTSQITLHGQPIYDQNVAKDAYLCSIEADRKQVLLSIDLEKFTNAELNHQFAYLTNDLRKKLGVEEPPAVIKTRQLKSLSAFLHHYAIQYLDILLYCLIKPKSKLIEETTEQGPTETVQERCWTLTNPMVAKLLNEYDLDGEHIKGWVNIFYEEKLFNTDYMELFIEKMRSDPVNLRTNMSSLL
jgi:hypothetical protein